MLSQEKNERLTQVGPDTPAGELLRRYWHPICIANELTEEKPKKRIRVLGEDLVVYRNENGTYSCLAEQCAHRGCSLYYGFIEGEDLRCPYHGWKYDKEGHCIEQPFEPKGAYHKKINQIAYPIQEKSGLLFIYMGPKPAPLLPNWGPLVRKDGKRKIHVNPTLQCNWLQIQENTVDSVHTYYLHGHTLKINGVARGDFYYRPIEKYDWKYCEWGIEKKIVYGGDQPGEEIRPPMIFPNILLINVPEHSVHWRVPIDDTKTEIFTVKFFPNSEGVEEENLEPIIEYIQIEDVMLDNGDYNLVPDNPRDQFYNQDRMAWETQGPIFDRSREHLGASDRGIAMFRKLLEEQIDVVQQGKDPLVVIRDPEKNKIIEFESTLPRL